MITSSLIEGTQLLKIEMDFYLISSPGMKFSHYIVLIFRISYILIWVSRRFLFFQQVLICTPILIAEERKIRKNFTEEEVNYIFSGVKKMGNHWNAILWSFPFQQGRKSVHLAQKYHKLTKRPKFVAP